MLYESYEESLKKLSDSYKLQNELTKKEMNHNEI